jgi:myo-inositol-1(or 4)-monophosphatase
MNSRELRAALQTMETAARAAGHLMRKNVLRPKKVTDEQQHDIKLELDVRCQKEIEQVLLQALPEAAVLGEEGARGDSAAGLRWVVDPIDGTVNYAYGIPHACVSIALQCRRAANANLRARDQIVAPEDPYQTVAGVVYDPFCEELWTASAGQPAYLNGTRIEVSKRSRLKETIVSVGFAKATDTLEEMLPTLNVLARKVRKIRIMGAAALAMVYVASGRFDAYIESGVRLWDIAAGGLILECAGGEFFHHALAGEHRYRVIANNGLLRKKLQTAQMSAP